MADKVITFRPKASVAEIITRKRDEGCNISAYLNQLVENAEETPSRYDVRFRLIPMPDGGDGNLSTRQREAFRPVGSLNVRLYNDYLKVLHEQGLQLYRFPIDTDHSVSIVSVNREEASMSLERYYTRRSPGEPYVRTSCPLPSIYFNAVERTVLIKEYEKV